MFQLPGEGVSGGQCSSSLRKVSWGGAGGSVFQLPGEGISGGSVFQLPGEGARGVSLRGEAPVPGGERMDSGAKDERSF